MVILHLKKNSSLHPLFDSIFSCTSASFEKVAIEVYRYQYEHIPLYQQYCDLTHRKPNTVKSLLDIPFLPISMFKKHKILDGESHDVAFTSSGTSGNQTSTHYVKDQLAYEKSFLTCFEQFYGPVKDFALFALLPSYLERSGSSLIYMVDYLIKKGKSSSGFYLYNTDELITNISASLARKEKVILFGVSFALLDLAEQHEFDFSKVTIIETGGMKGRKKEIIRSELHQFLCNKLQTKNIHSEYGMTELLSQAYSLGDEKFHCPPWMKVLLRSHNDPFHYLNEGKTGGINVIDLANLHSCAFIETQDLGRMHADGTFEVLGRFDLSDVRGCNLLIQ